MQARYAMTGETVDVLSTTETHAEVRFPAGGKVRVRKAALEPLPEPLPAGDQERLQAEIDEYWDSIG